MPTSKSSDVGRFATLKAQLKKKSEELDAEAAVQSSFEEGIREFAKEAGVPEEQMDAFVKLALDPSTLYPLIGAGVGGLGGAGLGALIGGPKRRGKGALLGGLAGAGVGGLGGWGLNKYLEQAELAKQLAGGLEATEAERAGLEGQLGTEKARGADLARQMAAAEEARGGDAAVAAERSATAKAEIKKLRDDLLKQQIAAQKTDPKAIEALLDIVAPRVTKPIPRK